QIGVGTLEVSPVALAFQAEHPAARLPAVADLTTDRAAGCVVAALGTEQARGHIGDEIPALAARAAATVDTDVETAPVIERRDHRRGRLGIRTRSQISSRCGSRQAQRNEANRPQQNLLHGILS